MDPRIIEINDDHNESAARIIVAIRGSATQDFARTVFHCSGTGGLKQFLSTTQLHGPIPWQFRMILKCAIVVNRIDIAKMMCERCPQFATPAMLLTAIMCRCSRITRYMMTVTDGNADCAYYAVLNGFVEYFEKPSIVPLEDYHVNDFRQRKSSAKMTRLFVMAGGWMSHLNPRDYLFEISEKHRKYPSLVKYIDRHREYSCALSDIVIIF